MIPSLHCTYCLHSSTGMNADDCPPHIVSVSVSCGGEVWPMADLLVGDGKVSPITTPIVGLLVGKVSPLSIVGLLDVLLTVGLAVLICGWNLDGLEVGTFVGNAVVGEEVGSFVGGLVGIRVIGSGDVNIFIVGRGVGSGVGRGVLGRRVGRGGGGGVESCVGLLVGGGDGNGVVSTRYGRSKTL